MSEEREEIKYICEKYGYGNVMQQASELWKEHMIASDHPTSGVFIPVLKSDIEQKQDKIIEQIQKSHE